MDTLIFGLILATSLIIIFKPKRWIVLTSFGVTFAATAYLFAHHVTTSLGLSF